MLVTQSSQATSTSARFEPGNKARLDWHGMRILNAAGQTLDVHQLFANLLGHVGEIGKCCDDTNLLRENYAGWKPSIEIQKPIEF